MVETNEVAPVKEIRKVPESIGEIAAVFGFEAAPFDLLPATTTLASLDSVLSMADPVYDEAITQVKNDATSGGWESKPVVESLRLRQEIIKRVREDRNYAALFCAAQAHRLRKMRLAFAKNPQNGLNTRDLQSLLDESSQKWQTLSAG